MTFSHFAFFIIYFSFAFCIFHSAFFIHKGGFVFQFLLKAFSLSLFIFSLAHAATPEKQADKEKAKLTVQSGETLQLEQEKPLAQQAIDALVVSPIKFNSPTNDIVNVFHTPRNLEILAKKGPYEQLRFYMSPTPRFIPVDIYSDLTHYERTELGDWVRYGLKLQFYPDSNLDKAAQAINTWLSSQQHEYAIKNPDKQIFYLPFEKVTIQPLYLPKEHGLKVHTIGNLQTKQLLQILPMSDWVYIDAPKKQDNQFFNQLMSSKAGVLFELSLYYKTRDVELVVEPSQDQPSKKAETPKNKADKKSKEGKAEKPKEAPKPVKKLVYRDSHDNVHKFRVNTSHTRHDNWGQMVRRLEQLEAWQKEKQRVILLNVYSTSNGGSNVQNYTPNTERYNTARNYVQQTTYNKSIFIFKKAGFYRVHVWADSYVNNYTTGNNTNATTCYIQLLKNSSEISFTGQHPNNHHNATVTCSLNIVHHFDPFDQLQIKLRGYGHQAWIANRNGLQIQYLGE
jgi:hypothetical protein